jgi:hypothetical protein
MSVDYPALDILAKEPIKLLLNDYNNSMNPIKVTISGSYRKHFDRIISAKQAFESLGAEVVRPISETITNEGDELVRLQGDPESILAIQDQFLQAVADSDILYVVNPGGYLGPSATFAIGYADRGNQVIVTSEDPFEEAIRVRINAVGDPQQALRQVDER